MRKLEFRAWDRDSKKYLRGYKLNDIWTKTNTLEDDEMMFTIFSPYLRSVVIEQYTGLTDKNGKDIYENDVVQSENGKKFVVVYLSGFLNLESLETENSYSVSPTLFPVLNLPVIGNVHQNADLLSN